MFLKFTARTLKNTKYSIHEMACIPYYQFNNHLILSTQIILS